VEQRQAKTQGGIRKKSGGNHGGGEIVLATTIR
jgi:hypothetical protein